MRITKIETNLSAKSNWWNWKTDIWEKAHFFVFEWNGQKRNITNHYKSLFSILNFMVNAWILILVVLNCRASDSDMPAREEEGFTIQAYLYNSTFFLSNFLPEIFYATIDHTQVWIYINPMDLYLYQSSFCQIFLRQFPHFCSYR